MLSLRRSVHIVLHFHLAAASNSASLILIGKVINLSNSCALSNSTTHFTGQLEEYLAANETHRSCVGAVIQACYRTLGLIVFYTAVLPSDGRGDDGDDGSSSISGSVQGGRSSQGGGDSAEFAGMESQGMKNDRSHGRLKCWMIRLGATIVEAAAMIDINIARYYSCSRLGFYWRKNDHSVLAGTSFAASWYLLMISANVMGTRWRQS